MIPDVSHHESLRPFIQYVLQFLWRPELLGISFLMALGISFSWPLVAIETGFLMVSVIPLVAIETAAHILNKRCRAFTMAYIGTQPLNLHVYVCECY